MVVSSETFSTTRSSRADLARRVRDLLRTRINQREFRDGRLPDESCLMAEYGLGRNVVRAALSLLQQEGVVTRTQGLGTFVVTQRTSLALRGANGFAGSVDGSPTRLVSRVISAEEFALPVDMARRLGVSTGTPCLAVDLTTAIDGTISVVLTSYLVDAEARAAVRMLSASGSWYGDWYELLALAGLRPVRREVTTEAVGVDPVVGRLLGLPAGAPVMRCERHLLLGDREVPEFGYSYCRGDRVAFHSVDDARSTEVCR